LINIRPDDPKFLLTWRVISIVLATAVIAEAFLLLIKYIHTFAALLLAGGTG